MAFPLFPHVYRFSMTFLWCLLSSISYKVQSMHLCVIRFEKFVEDDVGGVDAYLKIHQIKEDTKIRTK